jgi:hypothetical protein
VTAFAPAHPSTSAVSAGAYGPALPAKDLAWDGAATPTLTQTDHATGAADLTVSGQAVAGFAGIPAPLLSAVAGKNPYSVSAS